MRACDVERCKEEAYGTVELYNLKLDVTTLHDLCGKHYAFINSYMNRLLKGDITNEI